jgi:predicted RNase H-like nuclease (RuvC/YqgF family)
VDHDYCVLIAEYSRDELERTRRHEQQQHERQQREQQQQLANAHVMTTRVMTAFSALEERYEACATELAESREESEGWRDDLGRFGRRQYEERRAADHQHTANAALIATLNRELEDARHTITQHNNNNNNNNNGHMMCPVCHESYVDLQATGN